eukprot:PITA_32290
MQNIQNWWTQATIRSDNIMYIIQQKLKTIKTNLKQWSKDTFGDIIQAKRELEGERNTSFFHKSTIHNRAFNHILSLKSADGDQVFSRDHIGSELNSYFTSLLSKPLQDRSQAIKEILGSIPSLVTEDQNALLLRKFTEQEIEETIFSMATNKAPEPDGFTIEFFKAC